MPDLTTVTVNDRLDTPVSHAFVPVGKDATGVALFRETNGSVLDSNTLTVRSYESGPGNTKVRLVLRIPQVYDPGNGAPIEETRVAYADLMLTFAPEATVNERKELVGIMSNLLAGSDANIDAVVLAAETWY